MGLQIRCRAVDFNYNVSYFANKRFVVYQRLCNFATFKYAHCEFGVMGAKLG